MNESSAFGYQEKPGTPMGPVPPGGPNSMAQYKFSPDEMRVLKECNKESFFQRSVPLSTVLGFGTFAAVQRGHLRPNPRFGAIPKVSLAVVVGYFLGKLSYQQACAEKLMALPGSYIGQMLRDRRDGLPPLGRTSGAAGPGAAGGMLGAAAADIYSDAGPGSALDLDTDRPVFSGEDTYRPDNDSGAGGGPGGGGALAGPARPPLSYDELRRQNRGEHAAAKQDPYRVDPTPRARAPAPLRPPPPPATNQYGDTME